MSIVAIPTDRNHHLAVKVRRPGERRSMSRSATRALDVLEAFGTARRPLRAVEIARALDLTPSSANQLLKTMVDSAHLLFDARTKTYQPSPRLGAIASWLAETYGVDSGIAELVRDVHDHTRLVTTVTVPNDLFMQVIDLAGHEGGGERGLKISLFGSAIGSAFLSTLQDADVLRLANRARVPDTEMPAVLETLSSIRNTGHASGPTTSDDIWSIAMALPEAVLNGQAVLGLAGPTEAVLGKFDCHVEAMREAIGRCISPGEASGQSRP